MRGLAKITAAAAALLLWPTLPAAAGTMATAQGTVEAGPLPAGSSVLWMEARGDAPPVLLRADPGASPEVLATLSAPAGAIWPYADLSLAASATTWAAGVYVPLSRSGEGPWVYEILSGSTGGGPANVLASCDTGAQCACPKADLPEPPLVAVSRDTVAHQDLCRPGVALVAGQRVKTGGMESLQLAGRYLAWQDDGYVLPHLYDLERRAVIARVGNDTGFSFTVGQSLQDDGTLVSAASPDEGHHRIARLSPSRPHVRFVPAPPGDYAYDAQVAGNRIVALMNPPRLNYLAAEADRVLWAGDRSGRHWRVVGRFGTQTALGEFSDGGADQLRVADGLLAWVSVRCQSRTTIDAATVAGLLSSPLALDETGCRRAIVPPQPIALHDGRIRVRVRCPQACAGSLDAGFGAGPRRRVRFSRDDRGETTVAVQLPPAFLGALRRGSQRLHVFLRQGGHVVYAAHTTLTRTR